ncbi:hypothetical protein CL614_02495 [archaeon]|nr:hypothetical protein [archaeon]
MVSISRRPRTGKEFDEIIQEYWEKVIPMYRVKDTGALIEFDVTAWANSELEIFSGYNEGGPNPTKGYPQYKSNKIGNLIESWTPTDILRTADGYHLKLKPNRWMVLFRKGIEDKDRNEIFIFYVLDIESRKGGYQTIWANPPRLLRERFHSGKIFIDWGPRGWAANADAEWAYLDVAKDTGGFINWPFENPLHRGGRA